uniref:Uncharacterized protein, isoform B n=1 Tax=Drosophila melanogaster TaxID=7227 RepID=M9PBN8_DROME|nr:uncharacterized protein Dmel_CG13689, isoform B [Drosophila melanogaster]AGB92376.1 uncharacterized protein Dmel_CG13689, isoform B [Drosophila melanogaster]|eukprot:NP_001259839.1 uncharacterized protein Dmel_CG13689, isoform B [Drosophila melanogaster]
MEDWKSEEMARKRNRNRSKQRRRRQKIYQSLFEWHHNHVMSLCPEVNPNLDQDLEDIPKETGTFHCLDYVYESSSEDEEIEPIDEGYLKFLEVTIKHQQELRDRRTAQTTDSLD